VEIRPYRDADRDAVAALWRAAFPDDPPRNEPFRDVARKLGVQPELFLVAVQDGSIVGTAMAGDDGHRGWVHRVAVASAVRRRGIGSALMREAEARLAARGCPKLNLQVRAPNPGAVAFYQSLGFAVEQRVSMGKLLTAARAR
jgi:ribosomal protein S18 acetylase RimI-like enzyme